MCDVTRTEGTKAAARQDARQASDEKRMRSEASVPTGEAARRASAANSVGSITRSRVLTQLSRSSTLPAENVCETALLDTCNANAGASAQSKNKEQQRTDHVLRDGELQRVRSVHLGLGVAIDGDAARRLHVLKWVWGRTRQEEKSQASTKMKGRQRCTAQCRHAPLRSGSR